MPPGASPFLTMCTSIAGISLMRSALVVVEIALLDTPVLQRDLAPKRRAQSIDDGALHLRFDRVRIDGDAAIDRADHALDGDLAIRRDGNLGDLRHVGAEHILHGDAAARALPAKPVPSRISRAARSSTACARGNLLDKRAPVGDRVLLSRGGKLVDEALDHEDIVRGADTPPEGGRDAGRLMPHIIDAACSESRRGGHWRRRRCRSRSRP